MASRGGASAALVKLLGVTHPLVQAPMAGVSTPQLAAAVSNAGALGSIALGASTTTQARALIHETRALTNKPFNANVFCHRPAIADAKKERVWAGHLTPLFHEFGAEPPEVLRATYDSFLGPNESMMEMLLEEKPSVVSFHFGLPAADWVRSLRRAGSVTLACVTKVEEAHLAADVGVDALIAQGFEAGGHRGVFDSKKDDEIGVFALTQLIANDCDLPVLAAGGIMNGRGIAAAIQLGAAGAQLGTAFILCPESAADQAFRSALQSERAHHTQVSACISGRPARGLVTRSFTDIGGVPLPDYPIPYDAAKALDRAARAQGNYDFAVQWAGQGAPLARAVPAGELVAILMREYHACPRSVTCARTSE